MHIRGEITVAGNLVEDILVRPVERIEYGATVWVESIEEHLGGNGSNTSYALAKLGVPVRLRGAVGRDEFGDRVLERLREAGVHLDGVERRNTPTATTVVLVARDGSRSFLHRPGVSSEIFSQPLDFEGPPAHFHLANIFSLPHMRRTGQQSLRRARQGGWTTSLDTGHDAQGEWMAVAGPCLAHLDLLLANESEARRLTGCVDERAAARAFTDQGVKCVAIKLGARGCAVFHQAGEIWAPAFPVPTIDTTGAGDCFTAGFLAALWRGQTLPEAARLANACGALSASSLGSVTGIRPWAETLAWMEAQKKSS